MHNIYLYISFLIILQTVKTETQDSYCYKDDCKYEINRRYLFYDVNPSEGFNLRRDVYMRLAVLIHNLQYIQDDNLRYFQLVLPPWSRLVHWPFSDTPEMLSWSTFFDVDSMKQFAPLIEMQDYFSTITSNLYAQKVEIDQVWILQHFHGMFESGQFEEKWQFGPCHDDIHLNYWYYQNITSNHVDCISFHGSVNLLIDILKNSTAKSIIINHAEILLHDYFGDSTYWKARRSMRFNKNLKQIANDFRTKHLDSNDWDDNTYLPDDWEDEKARRNAKGGPYLAVHLRRRDFLQRPDSVKSLDNIVEQIKRSLIEWNLRKVFVATDSPNEVLPVLKRKLSGKYEIYNFNPDPDVYSQYRDGGVAVIEQIICSYGRLFIGTYESTFSFRIQEEREIIGFPIETTFNSFCNDQMDVKKCRKPSIWKIVY